MTALPNLDHLGHPEKDALVRALRAQVQSLGARVAELEAKLNGAAQDPGEFLRPAVEGAEAERSGQAEAARPEAG